MREPAFLENLHKRYGSRTAIDGISLTINPGECMGIFGRSGSGKSTLLRMIAGTQTMDSGSRSISDCLTFYAQDALCTESMLTCSEFLWLHATLCDIPRKKRHAAIIEALTMFGLDSERDLRISQLPSAHRRLLSLLPFSFSPSPLLLFDEPFSGLDDDHRRRLWEYLLKIRSGDGKSVVIATSKPDDAELCDRLVVIHEGRKLIEGTPDDIAARCFQEAMIVQPIGPDESEKSTGSRVLVRDNAGEIVVEGGRRLPTDELLSCISHGPGAVRLRRAGLGTVLDELILGAGSPIHENREEK